jgi:hypothetical protein
MFSLSAFLRFLLALSSFYSFYFFISFIPWSEPYASHDASEIELPVTLFNRSPSVT